MHGPLLQELIDDATASMTAASRGAAICSFTRAGVPVPALKQAEGRVAALRELRRSGADRATVDTLSAAWRARLAQLEARGAGSDWIAYATGGIEALEDAIACQDIAD